MASIFFFLIFSAFVAASAQQRQFNISLGSSLTPAKNSSWLSSSGLYAFGFYQQADGYAVGIFIAGIPQKTVVWTANRDDPPVSINATLQFTKDGRLILKSTETQETVIANPGIAASHASMLDSGNFVLHSSDHKIIWQSFDHPTDTLLPSQFLKEAQLVSSVSKTDHSTGIFFLAMQGDGNLVMYPVQSITVTTSDAYWASDTAIRDNVTLHFDHDGHLYLQNGVGSNFYNLTEGGYPTEDTIYLARIDPDGIFRLYSHKLNEDGDWSMLWKVFNDNCTPQGLCGLNGFCVLIDREADCRCVPGFDFVRLERKSEGCKRNFVSEICNTKNGSNDFRIDVLENTTWDDAPYSILPVVNREDCEKACLDDCNCEAALLTSDGKCSKQRLPLRYGRRRNWVNSLALIKVGNPPQLQGQLNISLGSSLTPTNNSLWLSSSGLYAFGFHQQADGYAVGIFIARIPQKTVVWTANRDDPPVSRNAVLQFTKDGRLVLQSTETQETDINNSGKAASHASMLDSGNFVLYGSDHKIIWQSFDHPTDTLLPSQFLKEAQMVSSVSETDHSTGNFRLEMQSDGNLVLYPVQNFPSMTPNAYWDSNTNITDNVTLHLDDDGRLYLLNGTGSNIRNFAGGYPTKDTIYLMRIDPGGIFRLYSHKLNEDGDWSMLWQVFEDKCRPQGLCGLNGFCVLNVQEADCRCLPGFEFIRQDRKSMGCKRNFVAEICNTKNGSNIFRIVALENTAWEDAPYSVLPLENREECEKACLDDCNCEAALLRGDGSCRKQRLPLRYGRRQMSYRSLALIKVGSKKEHRVYILIIGVSLVSVAFIILAISGILAYRSHIRGYKRLSADGNVQLIEDVAPRSFTHAELERVTDGFKEELGRGAFGTVYKGRMGGQKDVAVKRLEKLLAEGEQEFQTEMKVIGRTHHRNLVRLLGYCLEGPHRLLVYEYMSNGSLADALFTPERQPCCWDERMAIANDIARGILYLHEECETQIIHCDIKPQNILMNEYGCAKISDFGMAKLMKQDQTRTLTGIRGTKGYVAPEWHRKLPVSVKADVYSFGIVLLEIICCRKSVDWSLPEEDAILENWVYDCLETGQLGKLVGEEEVDRKQLARMVKVGIWCILDEPSIRPSMRKVLQMLEGTVDIPVPPSPTSFLTTI